MSTETYILVDPAYLQPNNSAPWPGNLTTNDRQVLDRVRMNFQRPGPVGDKLRGHLQNAMNKAQSQGSQLMLQEVAPILQASFLGS